MAVGTGLAIGTGLEVSRMLYNMWLEHNRRQNITEEQKEEIRKEEDAKFYGKYHKDNLTKPPGS